MIGVYFSGSGNSKHCLSVFMKEYTSECKIKSIEDEDVRDEMIQSDTIVFAYPVYYSTLPKIVHDFIVKNKDVFKGKKIFIIATMGLFSGDGTGCSARLFKAYGAQIIGGIHVKMPDSIADEQVLKKSVEKNKEVVKASEEKIIKAVKQTRNGRAPQEGLSFVSQMIGLFGQRLWFGKKTKTWNTQLSIHQDRCIGCGKCVSLCPLENIILVKDKAISMGRCTMCYRCVNYCPKQAITLLGKEVIEQVPIEKFL